MNQLLPATAKRKARRLVLLASVAGLAIAAVAAGPSSFNGSNLPAFTTPALADSVQPSAGFADIVAKVKPAVISVRVKIDETAKTTGMGDNDESELVRGFPSRSSSSSSVSKGCSKACRRPSRAAART